MLALLDWNNTFIVQTDASCMVAGAEPLQPEGDEEQLLTFASHRVLETESR